MTSWILFIFLLFKVKCCEFYGWHEHREWGNLVNVYFVAKSSLLDETLRCKERRSLAIWLCFCVAATLTHTLFIVFAPWRCQARLFWTVLSCWWGSFPHPAAPASLLSHSRPLCCPSPAPAAAGPVSPCRTFSSVRQLISCSSLQTKWGLFFEMPLLISSVTMRWCSLWYFLIEWMASRGRRGDCSSSSGA